MVLDRLPCRCVSKRTQQFSNCLTINEQREDSFIIGVFTVRRARPGVPRSALSQPGDVKDPPSMSGSGYTGQRKDTMRELGVCDFHSLLAPLVRSVSVSKSGDALGTSDRPPRGLEHSCELLHERMRRESSVEQPEDEFLKPALKKSRGQGELVPLLGLHCVNWTIVVTIAACNQWFGRLGLPILYQLRHDAASHAVFNPFLDVTEVPRRSHEGGFRKAAPQGGRSHWLEVYRQNLAEPRCPHRDKINNAHLKQRGGVGGATMETHSRMESIHVSCVRAPVASVSNVCSDNSAAPHHMPHAVSQKSVDSYSPSMDETSPACKHGWLPLLSLLATAQHCRHH